MTSIPAHRYFIYSSAEAAANWLQYHFWELHQSSIPESATRRIDGPYVRQSKASTFLDFRYATLDIDTAQWKSPVANGPMTVELVTLTSGRTEVAVYFLCGEDAPGAREVFAEFTSALTARWPEAGVELPTAAAPQIDPIGDPAYPAIPEAVTGRDRRILDDWRNGFTGPQLGNKYHVTSRRIYNLLSDMRVQYGEAIVPSRKSGKPR